MDFPRLRDPILYALIAALVWMVAWRADRLPDWIRLFLTLVGIILTSAAIVSALDFILYKFTWRIQQIRSAMVEPTIRLAEAMRGLSQSQIDTVAYYQNTINIEGMIGSPGVVVWTIKGKTINIPIEFVLDFLEWSKRTEPYLWPIRTASEIGVAGGNDGWKNARQYTTELTSILIDMDYAEKAIGVHSAILTDKYSIDDLLAMFKLFY